MGFTTTDDIGEGCGQATAPLCDIFITDKFKSHLMARASQASADGADVQLVVLVHVRYRVDLSSIEDFA